jgi:hypothetical protein
VVQLTVYPFRDRALADLNLEDSPSPDAQATEVLAEILVDEGVGNRRCAGRVDGSREPSRSAPYLMLL